MSYREILVYSSIGKLADRMSDYAVRLASTLKSRLAAIVVEPDFLDYSEIESFFADAGAADTFQRLVEQRRQRHEAALRAGTTFQEIARKHGVPHDTFFKTCVPIDIPRMVTEVARLYDCTILPSVEDYGGLQVPVVEEVLFGSGRPLIVLPIDRDLPSSKDNIVFVAWDGSRPATRAVHDAMPIMQQAALVEVITITEEKPLDQLPTGQDLVRHLKAHDVNARYGEVRFDGKPIGEQIMHEAVRFDAGLLIMGAYGHSRLRQIVFGGATRSVLKTPLLPVLLSY